MNGFIKQVFFSTKPSENDNFGLLLSISDNFFSVSGATRGTELFRKKESTGEWKFHKRIENGYYEYVEYAQGKSIWNSDDYLFVGSKWESSTDQMLDGSVFIYSICPELVCKYYEVTDFECTKCIPPKKPNPIDPEDPEDPDNKTGNTENYLMFGIIGGLSLGIGIIVVIGILVALVVVIGVFLLLSSKKKDKNSIEIEMSSKTQL